MGKKGNSGLGVAAVFAGGALLYNLFRQGQNTAATLTTARPANFRPVRLNGFNLECEMQVLFTNNHPSRPAQLQSLGLTVSSESGVIIGTVVNARPQTLVPHTTTAVPMLVTIELAPLLLQVVNLAALPALLRSFTGVGSALQWVARQAGLRNCVLDGTAQVDGLVLPVHHVADLGFFAPVPPPPKPGKSAPTAKNRALTKKVVA